MKKAYLLLLPFTLCFNAVIQAQPGIIYSVVGVGIAGFGGDGQNALNAKLDTMGFVAVDDSANIYVADAQNNRIRKVYKQTGIIATIAGNGVPAWTGDRGLAVNAEIYYPFGIVVGHDFSVYFTDNGNGIVRKIDQSTGIITTIAGNGIGGFTGDDSLATSATFRDPTGIAVDGGGNVFIADDLTNTIRRVSPVDHKIYLFAGNGVSGFSGDGGPATDAELNSPEGIAADRSGNIFIADDKNFVIRQVNAFGVINTVAGIQGIDTAINESGTATNVPISEPKDVACDIFGNIYISDVGANLIRMVNLSANYEQVVAGDTGAGEFGDYGPAIYAELNYPIGIAVDTVANFYIADLLNFKVRLVSAVVASVPQISDLGNLTIFPNPTTGTLNVLYPASYISAKNSIEIVDITGRTISSFDKEARPNATVSLDVSALSTGMYFVKISDNNSASQQVYKFVKE